MRRAWRIAILCTSVLVAASSAIAQGAPPSPQDFAQAAAQSDAYEIATARVAQVEAQNPAIRDLARQILSDHTMTSQALKAAAAKSGLPPPPDTPNPDQARMLYALQSLKGQDFDREYVTQQVVAHHGALAVEDGYARSGADPNLKQAAASALPMIRHHLDVANQLKSRLPQ
jgi:putative membrane protein